MQILVAFNDCTCWYDKMNSNMTSNFTNKVRTLEKKTNLTSLRLLVTVNNESCRMGWWIALAAFGNAALVVVLLVVRIVHVSRRLSSLGERSQKQTIVICLCEQLLSLLGLQGLVRNSLVSVITQTWSCTNIVGLSCTLWFWPSCIHVPTWFPICL